MRKKIILIVCCLCLSLFAAACNAPKGGENTEQSAVTTEQPMETINPSGVSIARVQSLCEDYLGEKFANFTIEDSDSGEGKDFSCFTENLYFSTVYSISVSGSTDREGNVDNVMLTYSDVNVDMLTDEDSLLELLTKDVMDMNGEDIRVAKCFIGGLVLFEMIGAADNLETDALFNLFLKYEPIEYNGWKIDASMSDESGYVFLTATYQ